MRVSSIAATALLSVICATPTSNALPKAYSGDKRRRTTTTTNLRQVSGGRKKKKDVVTIISEAEMIGRHAKKGTVHSLELRPTSTLLFTDMDETTDANDRLLLESLMFPGGGDGDGGNNDNRGAALHGVYGTFRRLSLPSSDYGTNANSRHEQQLVDRIRRHNDLLDQFNSERHLSRFERHAREVVAATTAGGRRSRGRRVQEDGTADPPPPAVDPAPADPVAPPPAVPPPVVDAAEEDAEQQPPAEAVVQNVEQAAQQDITEAAVETLYEGVLPVIPPDGEGGGDEATVVPAAEAAAPAEAAPAEETAPAEEAAPAAPEAAVPPVAVAVAVAVEEPANEAAAAAAPEAAAAETAPEPVAQAQAPAEDATTRAGSACFVNPECAAQGLTGECCPTAAGPFLACCPQAKAEAAEAAKAAAEVAAAQVAEEAAPPAVEVAPPAVPEGTEDPAAADAAATAAAATPAAPEVPTEPATPVEEPPIPLPESGQPEENPPAPAEEVAANEEGAAAAAAAHPQDVIVDNAPDDVAAMAAATAIAEERASDPSDNSTPIPDDAESLSGGLLNSYQTTPLGQGYGTHYAHVWVGSPQPQRQSVIVDTGSHHTAFPCKECAKCGEEHHTDHYFDWSQSKTFRPLKCAECEAGASCSGGKCIFSQSYTEGSSWRAYQVKDQFFCGGNEPDAWRNPVDASYAIDFTFGCQTSETGLFITQLADGIMGMAANDATLTKRMYNAKKIEHLMFAMCFRRELHQSKEGVTAGVLTMGGVDTRLHSSPMVYARNTMRQGWFTVYVRGLYIRSNGGQSAGADSSDQHVTKININLSQVNSGKGVIVDSGTTDTYFHRSLKGPFEQAFKAISGKAHSNKPIKMSKDELLALPTVLVQVDAYDDKLDPSLGSADAIPGLAGELDEDRPADVMLAIPATHYMEYDPSADAYTSRLYFSEGSGGVLGANAMMGHDILFDWENKRVGFAESSCEYMVDVASEFGAGGDAVDEAGVEADCILGVPSMSTECVDTIDMSQCNKDGTTHVFGKEKWTMVVESPGTPEGMSCEEVILRDYAEDVHEEHVHPDPPIAYCDGKGLCFKERVCEMTCEGAVEKENEDIAPVTGGGGDEDDDNTDDDFFASFQPCGDNLWGACEYTCEQEKIISVLMTDGICHEDKSWRKKRPCHVDACGRSDPCRVPFVVHAVLGFRGANAQFWSRTADDEFVDAFAMAVDFNNDKGDELIGPGDVKVLMASPWYENDDPTRRRMGMKMILEISIYNEHARLPEGYHYDPITKEQAEAFEVNATAHSPNAADAVFNIIDNVENVWKQWSRPLSKCKESDILPLGKNALDVHVELERPKFMTELLGHLKQLNAVSKYASPFAPLFRDMAFAEDSKVLTSWTIKTEIDGGVVSEHPISSLKGINASNVMMYITNVPFMTLVLGLFFLVCCCGICCGSRCGRRRGYESKQIAALLEELERRKAEKARGKYSQVGANGYASSDEDSQDEIQFNGVGYRDHSYDDDDRSHDGDLELAEVNGTDNDDDIDELEAMDNSREDRLSGLKSELA